MSIPRRVSSLFLIAAVLCGAMCPPAQTKAASLLRETTILFTHDLHSHFLPQRTESGGESGGYARLKTALDTERAKHPDALTVDGGDFSVGSLIHTLYTTQAAELRTMGTMGYDAVAVGNHEFDHTGTGFAKMLDAAVQSGAKVPALLLANYKPTADNPNQLDIQRSMAAYGVRESMVLERGGVTYGIFGLMGTDANDCAPASGFTLEDAATAAKRCVAALKEQGADFIICLSHSGTDENRKRSEDEKLAEKVDGIDLIVSSHTHTTLTEPIVVGDTYIVSAGPYCENLGSITLRWSEDGSKTLLDYHLVPIDETLDEDPDIAALVDSWKTQVGSGYLSRYGLTYDQTLTTSGFDLLQPDPGEQTGNALGELVSDAFHWAANELAVDAPDVPTVAVTAEGMLRSNLYAGNITTSQAFDVLSLGVGNDGNSGYPLVEVYLTGKELKAVAEVDASIPPFQAGTQLYLSGLAYSFNTHRMFFNRVTDVKLRAVSYETDCGLLDTTELDNDQLYRVVASLYCAQMLDTVKSRTLGLLPLSPKMADGTPVSNYEDCILYDKHGNEIKEWYALAAYLSHFGSDGLPSRYRVPDGRKNVSHSWNPIQLLKNPNWITLVTILAILILAGLVALLARKLLTAHRGKRYGGGNRRKFGR